MKGHNQNDGYALCNIQNPKTVFHDPFTSRLDRVLEG